MLVPTAIQTCSSVHLQVFVIHIKLRHPLVRLFKLLLQLSSATSRIIQIQFRILQSSSQILILIAQIGFNIVGIDQNILLS